MLRTLLPLALASCVSLSAQDFRPGVHGGLNIPVGDLSDALDARLGFTIGGHLGIDYGAGHELRPRLDFTTYEGGWHPVGNNKFTKNSITALTLGADYVYYTEQRPVGFYLVMGLSNQWWNVNPKDGATESNSSLGLTAGAGFRPNRVWSFEARFTTGQFRSGNGQATQLQGVACLRL